MTTPEARRVEEKKKTTCPRCGKTVKLWDAKGVFLLMAHKTRRGYCSGGYTKP